jgi:predicted CXXCH cytochrome family protein
MFHEGIGCTVCHDPHGNDNWADLRLSIHDNALCLSCHDEYETVEAQTAHSRHAPGSPGNLCVECHMPRHMIFTNGVEHMSDRIFSHEFGIPTGEGPAGAPPSSCVVCHTDQSESWTRETLRLWRERPPAPSR